MHGPTTVKLQSPKLVHVCGTASVQYADMTSWQRPCLEMSWMCNDHYCCF